MLNQTERYRQKLEATEDKSPRSISKSRQSSTSGSDMDCAIDDSFMLKSNKSSSQLTRND